MLQEKLAARDEELRIEREQRRLAEEARQVPPSGELHPEVRDLAARNEAPAAQGCERSPIAESAVVVRDPIAIREAEFNRLIIAVGSAIEATDNRRARDVLHCVLTAQQEHLGTFMQGLSDQRQEYGDQLERAVVRFSELMPESLIQAGEVFHQSTGKLTGALSRIERLSGNQIEKHNLSLQLLGDIRADLAQFLAVATEMRDLLAHSLTGRPQPRHERRLAVVPASPHEPDDDTDILAKIGDDLDEPEEDFHGPH